MSDWYYLRDGQQVGPVAWGNLHQLAASGGLGAEDMVWQQGMPNWVKAASVSGLSFAAGSAGQPAPSPVAAAAPAAGGIGYYVAGGSTGATLSLHGLEMLRQTKPWVRFIAVLMFIFSGLIVVLGVFSVLGLFSVGGGRGSIVMMTSSLLYVAMGALYMIPAVFLNRYASGIATLMQAPHDQTLTQALQAQKSFWKFVGILSLIVICLYVVGIAVVFIGFAAMKR